MTVLISIVALWIGLITLGLATIIYCDSHKPDWLTGNYLGRAALILLLSNIVISYCTFMSFVGIVNYLKDSLRRSYTPEQLKDNLADELLEVGMALVAWVCEDVPSLWLSGYLE